MRWLSLAVFTLILFMTFNLLNQTALFPVSVQANTSQALEAFKQTYEEKGASYELISRIPVLGNVYQFFANLLNIAKLLGTAFYNSTVGLPVFLGALGMPGPLVAFVSALVWIIYTAGLIEFLRGLRVI